MRLLAITVFTATSLGACADNEPVDPNADAIFNVPAIENATVTSANQPDVVTNGPVKFLTADGAELGTVIAADTPAGLTLTLAGSAMPTAIHGLHLHSVGTCEGPKFESAGPHWNPTNRKHGSENPAGPHRGDLPNIVVGADGTLGQTLTLAGMTMADLLDTDGTALVIHADADDNKTDPSGNSGERIACAVIAPAR